MSDSRDIAAALDELLAAYQQLGTARRRALDLTANEAAALLLIGQGTTAPSALARAIGITTAGMTNMLDRLEAGGLIRREPHRSDKRRVLVLLTKQGFRPQLELAAVHHEVAELASEHDAAQAVHRFLVEAAALVRQEAAGPSGDPSE